MKALSFAIAIAFLASMSLASFTTDAKAATPTQQQIQKKEAAKLKLEAKKPPPKPVKLEKKLPPKKP